MRTKTVDVIIPTYKPDETFDRLLRGLLRQDYPVNKIIIINTEERFYRQKVNDGRIEVHHIRREEFDHGATRRQAADYSQADYMLFMTQDALPVNAELTAHLAEALEDETVAVAYARQLPAKDCNINERNARRFNYPAQSRKKTAADLETLGIKTFFCSDVCAMYRKETFDKLEGFPERAIFNEDMVFAARAVTNGYAVYYCAEACVIHSHNYTGRQQFQRNFDMGVSQVCFREIFAQYPAEGEGVRLVTSQAAELLRRGRALAVVQLIYISACKYAGYRLGKAYRRLPMWLIRRCSTSTEFFERADKL